MKALYFDCFSGISGDMTVAALLDLGINKDVFLRELEKLNIGGYRIEISEKVKCGIKGTDFNVILEHEHNHSHEDDHHNQHQHQHQHHHHHEDARNLQDICHIIDESGLNDSVKKLSKEIFKEVAKAEAYVHDKPIDEVHFHEVGAVDSIVDIVGASICINLLGVEKIFSSALHEGQGTIECAHGILPVPVPAVMQMLRSSNIPVITEDVHTELVTPTGIAIIKTVACNFGKMPDMVIESAGYGMGKRETGGFNALRVVLGELNIEKNTDMIISMRTNIDDISPEIIGYTMERLFESGALDVYQIPIHMKKNRTGTMLCVMCKDEDKEKLAGIIFSETGSLGIRYSAMQRMIQSRETVSFATRFGEIRAKLYGDAGKFTPEYDDCVRAAKEYKVSLNDVYNEVYGANREGADV